MIAVHVSEPWVRRRAPRCAIVVDGTGNLSARARICYRVLRAEGISAPTARLATLLDLMHGRRWTLESDL